MFTEKELEEQESTIRKYIFIGFTPVIIIIVIIFLYTTNSLDYNKKKYFNSRNTEIKGIVIYKYEEGDYPRANRRITLDTNFETYLYKEDYLQVSIGDSVIKRKGSDSIIFYLKDSSIITKDYNKYLREKYYELLKK